MSAERDLRDELQTKGAAIVRGALFAAQGDYADALRLACLALASITSPSKPSRDAAKLQVKSWVNVGR